MWPQHARGLRRRRVRGEDPRQGSPHRAHAHVALGQQDPQGGAAAIRGPRRAPASGCCWKTCPARFPFTAGVFAFKRENEDPTRMFAGEGDPFRTNRRFKMLSEGMPAKRLSTAFDSVTLYGNDPDLRPDIYGKVGNSGVSIATLDDLKVLYSGLRPHGTGDERQHDDQRPGAHDPRDVHEHRDRPEPRQVPRRQRPRAHRRRGAEDPRMGAGERARHRAGRHPQGGPGAEHLHLLHRVLAQGDGRHPGVVRPPRRAELLFRLDQRLPHRGGRGQSR